MAHFVVHRHCFFVSLQWPTGSTTFLCVQRTDLSCVLTDWRDLPSRLRLINGGVHMPCYPGTILKGGLQMCTACPDEPGKGRRRVPTAAGTAFFGRRQSERNRGILQGAVAASAAQRSGPKPQPATRDVPSRRQRYDPSGVPVRRRTSVASTRVWRMQAE